MVTKMSIDLHKIKWAHPRQLLANAPKRHSNMMASHTGCQGQCCFPACRRFATDADRTKLSTKMQQPDWQLICSRLLNKKKRPAVGTNPSPAHARGPQAPKPSILMFFALKHWIGTAWKMENRLHNIDIGAAGGSHAEVSHHQGAASACSCLLSKSTGDPATCN